MQKPLNDFFLTNGKERKHIDEKWHKNIKQQKSFKFGMFPQSCIIGTVPSNARNWKKPQ